MKHRYALTLVSLAILFIAPGLLAYAVYLHPQWLNQKTTNKGQLLKPPLYFPIEKYSLLVTQEVRAPKLAKIKLNKEHPWQLMVWSPSHCDKVCLEQLEKISRVRLALGRHFYEVKTVLLMGPQTKILTKNLIRDLQEKNIEVRQVNRPLREEVAFPMRATIFLANPNSFIVMAYQLSVQPNDIYHDLNLLLK